MSRPNSTQYYVAARRSAVASARHGERGARAALPKGGHINSPATNATERLDPRMSDTATKPSGAPPATSAKGPNRAGLPAEACDAKAETVFALVIDDQEAICRLVENVLVGLGVQCATYRTAKPAIASLDQRRPAIIFLDMALDNSDAIDVMKGLSEKRYTGIVQLMSGGRRPLLDAVQRIGTRYGLTLRPPLQKPVHADAVRDVVVKLGLAREAAPASISRAP
jgi:CheY-like chemotaxis protein